MRSPKPWLAYVIAVGLLLFGVEIWLTIGHGFWGNLLQLRVAALMLALVCIPWVYRNVSPVIEYASVPSASTRGWVSLGIAIGASVYLYFTAIEQGRPFLLTFHDEYQFRLQTAALAHGRLWQAPHPLSDFFDSFYVLTRPVYAAQSFPGLALLYAPTVWLGLPWWIGPLLVAGAITGLVYRIVTELFDGLAGALSVVFMLATPEFRRVSLMNLAQGPSLFISLVMIWLFLRWWRRKHWAWGLGIGAMAGWALLIRPADALFFIGPVAVAGCFAVRVQPRSQVFRMLAALILGALPFVFFQLLFNFGVTGSIAQTPFGLYNTMYQPGVGLGFSSVSPPTPPTPAVVQKARFYKDWVRPFINGHTPHQTWATWKEALAPGLFALTLPSILMSIFLPSGVWQILRDRRTRLVLMPVIGFLMIYPLYPIWVPHYAFVLIPVAATIAAVGVATLPRVLPARWRRCVTAMLLVPVAYTVAGLPQFDRLAIDDFFYRYPEILQIEKNLSQLPPGRAIVLFRFGEGAEPQVEPVYNVQTAWPDDAEVIRAHDLGEARNQALYSYYARMAPDRTVYRYSRPGGVVTSLGNVVLCRDQAEAVKAERAE